MTPLLVFSVLTLLSVGARSAAVEWSLGTGLWLYAQINPTDVTCPPVKPDADSNTNLCKVFVQNSKVICNRTPGEAGRRVLNLNGFAGTTGPLTQSTRLKVVELNSATGDGCWSVTQDEHVSITPCKLADGSQKLYFRRRDGNDGSYWLYTDHASKPLSVGPDGALVATDNAPLVFCMYETNQGNAVIPPYFPPDQINALAGIALPGPKDLQAEENLPGCKGAKDTTPDCLIARAVNGMPADCPANPGTRHCVLHLVAAFCSDIPDLVPGADNSAQVEFCFRNIALGPCVANAPGRACACGQFAGIVKFVDGGGHPGQKRKRTVGGVTNLARRENYGSNRDLFSDQQDLTPAEDRFWMGVMKNIINGFIDLLNAFRGTLFQSSRISCLSMTHKFPEGTKKGAEVRKGCEELFKPHKPVPNVPLQGDIEKAGSIFADVVALLSAVGDVAEAAKAAQFVGSGAVKAILKKFRPRPAIAADGVSGYVIEAKQGGNTVQIFRDAGDGQPLGIKTKEEYKEMKKSVGKNAFENCVTCAKPPVRMVKRASPPGSPPLKKLCCRPSSSGSGGSGGESDAVSEEYYTEGTDEEWTSGDSADPDFGRRAQTEFGPVTNPAGQADTSRILPKMTDEFGRWFKHFENIPLEADEVTKGWYNRLSTTHDTEGQLAIERDFMAQYHITQEETDAIREFVEHYEIDMNIFNTVLPKIPNTSGIVQRVTSLDKETVNMLIKGDPGLISKGERGVYEVQVSLSLTKLEIEDLVINYRETDNPPRQVLTSGLGFLNDFNPAGGYRYVINSRTGKFINPLVADTGQFDVLHVQGLSGRFRLIGYQPLNGGEATRLAGKPGPWGVFYLDEVAP
ncbi:uncharacterized protein J3D65DRAFT_674007 [Phyllosticta citribraziliensis]|uniref:Uncharacterized protein n=1 Tax=Phyllosticta citribraziliensis TaxID=989973 RepID=A0ABR1M597_9PEZI